jgi:N6-L-threonylcarbamoyladenine synthase
VPSLAKRAHEERIDWVISEVCKRAVIHNTGRFFQKNISGISYTDRVVSTVDAIAVTVGPGLAIALEVGIRKAKELARLYHKPILPINHMAGHIYSCFVQNGNGNPEVAIQFPYLAILISGGHTEFVILKNFGSYEVIGSTRDDAAGEAFDKAARMLGFQYPGGPIIERLAKQSQLKDIYKLPRPMIHSGDLNFSFSGLKTSFLYLTKGMSPEEKAKNIRELAYSFQEAVADTLCEKTKMALKQTGIKSILVGGGVIANNYIRARLRKLAAETSCRILYPPYPYLTADNAAMIGVAANFENKNIIVDPEDFDSIDRKPRLQLG